VLRADGGELSLQTPRFVRDTSQLWHRPNISREEGIVAVNIVSVVMKCRSQLSLLLLCLVYVVS